MEIFRLRKMVSEYNVNNNSKKYATLKYAENLGHK